MNRRGGDDEGLTLVELLVAMAIMLIIMTPLVTSFVLTLTTTTSADQDATNSADAQVLNSYFDHDVGNADAVAVTSTCGGSTSVLALTWLDGATQHVVAYQAEADPGLQVALGVPNVYRIVRYDCTVPGSQTSVVVARSAASVPTVLCDRAVCTSATTTPRTVTVTIQDLARKVGDPAFTLTVTGTRRVTS